MHLEPARPDTPLPHDRLYQSPRVDYSLPWNETGLANAAPPEAEGDWPSDRMRAHRAVCDVDITLCRHIVAEPEWWVLMGVRGVPLHPDAAKARQMAAHYINGFDSAPVLPPDVTNFIRDAVRDALMIAPQPVTDSWVKSALATVTSLVRFVVSENGALTRDHVFGERTRNRYLYVHLPTRDYKGTTVSTYRSRLDLIVLGLTGAVARDIQDRPMLPNSVPTDPISRAEEAALWTWALALRPYKRAQRTRVGIVLGLGVGARANEVAALTGDLIRRDENGVHVGLVHDVTGRVRYVTCRAAYEDRLLALVDAAPPGNPLASSWRETPQSTNTLGTALWQAQEAFVPPVYFNVARLRNTWLVRHIESGTPLPLLTEMANVKTLQSVIRLLPYCETPTPGVAAAHMRRA